MSSPTSEDLTSLLRGIPLFAELEGSSVSKLAERCVARSVAAGHVLLGGGPYPASAVTLEATRLVFLPRADFEFLYRTHPDIAQAIIRALGRRLRHLVQVTETLAFRDVAARLAMLLVGYIERTGRETPDGIEIVLDRTQEELAIEIGAARESVSRAMKQLRRRGLIRPLDHGRLLVPDVTRLRAILPAAGARAK